MVQQGDFKVQIVEAVSMKPFLEHTKDGMTFVEVEPNADYYIAVQRTDCSNGKEYFICFLVDGQDLGFEELIDCGTEHRPTFYGPVEIEGGVETTHALKFYEPDKTYHDRHFSRERFLREMGKVEVEVYECTSSTPSSETGQASASGRSASQDFSSSFHAQKKEVDVSRLGNEKEKYVLSSQGDKKMVKDISRSECRISADLLVHASLGRLLHTITLRYCSVKGLCKVGILPDLRSSTKHPAVVSPSSSPEKKRCRRGWKIEMQAIDEEDTADGNVPNRVVEVIVPEDDSSSDDDSEE